MEPINVKQNEKDKTITLIGSPDTRQNEAKKVRPPFFLMPIWWLAVFFINIGKFHDGNVSPVKSGLIGYLLIAKVLLAIPLTFAQFYDMPSLVIAFVMFSRINVMLYCATRVVKSINLHVKEKKKRVITKFIVITLFVLDIGLAWADVLIYTNQTILVVQ